MKKKICLFCMTISIVVLSSIVSFAGWEEDEQGWWYLNDDGSYLRSGIYNLDGEIYLFGDDGYIKPGWNIYNAHYYYVEESGKVCKGWKSVNGKWYYMDKDGVMQKGFLEIGKKMYYLNDDGSMAVGMIEINGNHYYAQDDGVIIRNKTTKDIRYDNEGVIMYRNKNTDGWEYMPEDQVLINGLENQLTEEYERGAYRDMLAFEKKAREKLSPYISEEEIEEFIDETEDTYFDSDEEDDDYYRWRYYD